ncbi:O-antigen ligase family protein [Pedobacter ghigonis]|uniref:O-antigen ligase family protein n=1 Tax=Pedobacter ghigonis TaxID=2730403 RepID=UPI00293BFFB2|nr:O-antigen ligase family protein [Pedobacter ghigonis]
MLMFGSSTYDDDLPNHLINYRELYILISSALFTILIFGAQILKGRGIQLTKIDIAVIGYFLFIGFRSYHQFDWSYLVFFSISKSVNYILLYFLVRVVSFPIKSRSILASPFLLIFIIQLMIGMCQVLGLLESFNLNFKVSGLFFNPGPYIIHLSSLFPLLLFLLLEYWSKIPLFLKIVFSFLTMTFAYLVIIGDSRSAWIAIFITSSIIGILHYYEKLVGFLNTKTISLLSVLLLFSSLVLYNYKYPSSVGRLFIWMRSFELFLKKPFFGVGKGFFGVNYQNMQMDYFQMNPHSSFIKSADDVRFAFNDYLQILCEVGIVGLVLYLLIFVYLLKPLINNKYSNNSNVLPFYISLLSILICGLFSYPSSTVEIQSLCVILIAIIAAKQEPATPVSIQRSLGVILPYTFCIIALCILVLSTVRYRAFSTFSAFSSRLTNKEALLKYEKLFPFIKDDPTYTLNYASLNFRLNRPMVAISLLENGILNLPEKEYYYHLASYYNHMHNFKKTEQVLLKINYNCPNLLYPKYLLAKFYHEKNKTVQFQMLAKQIASFEAVGDEDLIDNLKTEIYLLTTLQSR